MKTEINGEDLLKKISSLKIDLSKDKRFNSFEYAKIKYGIGMVETTITNMMMGKDLTEKQINNKWKIKNQTGNLSK